MHEVFKAAITGFNLIPTLFLLLMILYWLTMMTGLLHDHSFEADGDADFDTDGEGIFHGILVFFKIGEIPVALLLSFITLFWWFSSNVITLLLKLGVVMTGIMLIPELIVAYLLTMIILSPFRKFFKELKSAEKDTPIENKLCKLVSNLEPGRIGQASIATKGAPILINVRSSDGSSMKIGDDAVVVVKDEQSDIYEIKQIKDIITPDVTGGTR